MKNWIRGVLGGGVLSAALFISGHALAGVSNPAYYTVTASDMEIYNTATSVYAIGDTGSLYGDLASDASFAYDTSSFSGVGVTAISGGGVTSQFLVGATGTSGVIDPFTKAVTFTLHLKIKFSGTIGGVTLGNSCVTSYFNVTISTDKTSTPWTASKFDPSNGGFLAVAEDFTIPQVTAANCGSSANASTINTTFNFGAASGGVSIMISGRVDTPQIPLP